MSCYQEIDCLKYKERTIKLPSKIVVDINPLDIDIFSTDREKQNTRELILVNIIEELAKTFKEEVEK